MATMTGVVEQQAIKEVTTKFGVKPTYSLKVNGSWVKFGFKKPPCNVGDEIQFDGESGTYGMEGKNPVVISKGSGAPSSPAAPAAKPSSSYRSEKVFPIPPLHGDRSIVRQNALARATELIIASKGSKGFDPTGDLIADIVTIARAFEAYTAGDIDLAAAKKEVEAEASVPF